MGRLFTLDAATKATIQLALDDIITEFGKDCLLVYPARPVACSNCTSSPGGKGASYWRHGGPLPFSRGSACPLCEGRGSFHTREASEAIRFKIEWEPARFWYPVPNIDIRAKHSFCQTKFYVADVPKVVKCDHVLIQLPIDPTIRARFRLAGTPISPGNIVQDRYAVATWEQIG